MPESSPSAVTVSACPDATLAMVLVRRGKAVEASRILQVQRGMALPVPGRLTMAGGEMLLWSGPERFLVVRDGGAAGLAQELAALLDGLAYVAEVSSSRSVLRVCGEGAAEWLTRLVPIDLHPRVFAVGSVALTIAAHVPIQIWRPDEDSFLLACPYSLATSIYPVMGNGKAEIEDRRQ